MNLLKKYFYFFLLFLSVQGIAQNSLVEEANLLAILSEMDKNSFIENAINSKVQETHSTPASFEVQHTSNLSLPSSPPLPSCGGLNLTKFKNDLKSNPELVDFFDEFGASGVKAWDVFQSSSDDILKALRTDVPTLTRFTDDFGNSTAAINQIKNSPDLLKSWHLDGAVLHRHYAGSSSWPVIQIDDAFKANVRSQYGDDVGDLVDAVDNLNISNNAAVGGGAYHPSLPSPSSNPNTAVNFLSGEVADGTAQAFINALHPILKKRVDYLEFLKSHNLIDASQQSITTAGKFGSHAEFRVLDKAIKDLEILEGLPAGSFPVSRLDEFTVFVKAKQGTNPPRCVCCWHGTDGVRMIGNE